MLPRLLTFIPGPKSRGILSDLARHESPGFQGGPGAPAIVWARARGANVWDADGNRCLDLAAGFGVASVGHGHPAVRRAIAGQSSRLIHGMGDVHPGETKARLAAALSRISPNRGRVFFSSTGAEAVETALKTAFLVTGRSGVLAFEGSYHGLGHGALAVTGMDYFRRPFEKQLGGFATFAPFGDLVAVERILRRDRRVGAVIVEPIQGRGGVVVPPRGFMRGLAALCRRRGVMFIADEIWTGFGRTGRMFAVGEENVVPDLLCVGKALGGGFPVSACIGRPGVMAVWGQFKHEALHTSTFLGNPLGCAMALAVLETLRRERLVARSRTRGAALGRGLASVSRRHRVAGAAHGRGLFWGLDIVDVRGRPVPEIAGAVSAAMLRRGVILPVGGVHRNVLTFSPPLVISKREMAFVLRTLDEVLAAWD
ncbi:MAG: aspartate aminotransferase family protein [Planctomycetota bacterium]